MQFQGVAHNSKCSLCEYWRPALFADFIMVEREGKSKYQHVYSPHCPPYISYATSWEILSKNQGILIFGDCFLYSSDLNVESRSGEIRCWLKINNVLWLKNWKCISFRQPSCCLQRIIICREYEMRTNKYDKCTIQVISVENIIC